MATPDKKNNDRIEKIAGSLTPEVRNHSFWRKRLKAKSLKLHLKLKIRKKKSYFQSQKSKGKK